MKRGLLKFAVLTAATGLTLGTASVAGASSATIDTTGPNSQNTVECKDNHGSMVTMTNENGIWVVNNNPQTAKTGKVEVEKNTTGGSAMSGDASNNSSLMASFDVTNSLPVMGGSNDNSASINNTGPDSYNKIELCSNLTNLRAENSTTANITNNNSQYASTGNAEVEHNTTGGGAGSGAASNTSSLTTNVTINNGGGIGAGSSDPSFTASISNTGPNSKNIIDPAGSQSVSINNKTELNITNNNTQNATSGSAEVSGNTSGGNATSGDATNTSSTTVMATVSN